MIKITTVFGFWLANCSRISVQPLAIVPFHIISDSSFNETILKQNVTVGELRDTEKGAGVYWVDQFSFDASKTRKSM